MITYFLLLGIIVTMAHFLSDYTPLAQYNWYLNWLYERMDKAKTPKRSNLYMKIFMSKLFTCKRCHFHHLSFMLLMIFQWIFQTAVYSVVLESLIMSLILWKSTEHFEEEE